MKKVYIVPTMDISTMVLMPLCESLIDTGQGDPNKPNDVKFATSDDWGNLW